MFICVSKELRSNNLLVQHGVTYKYHKIIVVWLTARCKCLEQMFSEETTGMVS